MVFVVLAILGLAFGSFVNALVWRLHEQHEIISKAGQNKFLKRLSIVNGRSMCPHCKHELSAKDLIPLFSWLILKGRCRYCKRGISFQYPAVELITALLFVASYLFWPNTLTGVQIPYFVLWLVMLVGLVALAVYDLRWMILPNRIVYPLASMAGAYAVIRVLSSGEPLKALVNTILSVAIGGGIFYVLYQISDGRWIGGGDVRLGWALGLIAGTPGRSILLLFLASVIGTLVSFYLMATGKAKRSSLVPFGPFLIVAVIIVQLFGYSILAWYQRTVLKYPV